MEKELRILMVEDLATDAELEIRELRRAGMRVKHWIVETEETFRQALQEFQPQLILSDFSMPHFDGMWALALARELAPEVPFIFVSGTIGEEYAIRALKNGATDYVLKNNLVRLPAAVERALKANAERDERRKMERELEETRSRLDSIVSSLSDVIWSVSPDPYRMLYISPAIEKLWQQPVEIFYADPSAWMNQIHPNDREQVQRLWNGALVGGVFDAVYRIALDSGIVRWIHDRAKSIFDADGKVVRLDGIARDITELKQQEQGIARLSRIHTVMSGINSAIVRIHNREELLQEACRIVAEDGKFRMVYIGLVDDATKNILPIAWAGHEDGFLKDLKLSAQTGTEHSGILARALFDNKPMIRHDIATEPGMKLRERALARGYRSQVVLPLVVNGEGSGVISIFAEEPGFFDEQELKLLIELASDVSFGLEYIEKEEELNYLAYYSALTGLPNRTLFNDRLEQRISTARRDQRTFTVLVLDIERFRNINETLGRQAGDDVLRQLSQRLKNAIEETNILAHFGSDYFVIATRHTEEGTDAAHFLEQLLKNVTEQPFQIGGDELRLAARAGIAVYPTDGTDVDSLLRNAEAAIKNAKKTGHRYLFYAPQMNARVAEQLTLENQLRRAVTEEQFILYYQPRINLSTNRIVGFEALIRWQHPERGLVPPGDFIPVLEDTGLILEVGRWALKRAVQDQEKWRAEGCKPLRVAVNVSALQLLRKDFQDDISAALTNASDPTEQLDIEITESMLMVDVEGNIEKLKAAQAMGVQVAMDDFGTGYCSLSYLAKLPINSLKIDRSFISQMSKGPEHMAIVSTIVSLARALNLKVVAEGVETEEQANLLRLLRCDEAQGFLFSRPVPPDEAQRLLISKTILAQ